MNLKKIFLNNCADLRNIWVFLICLSIIFLLGIISIQYDKKSCEKSGDIVADDSHYGWLEGCFYEINGKWIARDNFNEIYSKQEIDLNIVGDSR